MKPYLPNISGGKATWIAEAGSLPIAFLARQWPEPRYLVEADQSIASLIGNAARGHIYFNYWYQTAPDAVLEFLNNGNPLSNICS